MSTYETIDWDAAGELDYEYQRAVQGRPAPLPPVELATVQSFEGGMRAVKRAAKAIITFKLTLPHTNTGNGQKGKPRRSKNWKPADVVIADFLGPLAGGEHRNALWHRFLTVALAYAKQDPRYWGVTNTRTHAWCAYCRQIRPVSQFTHSEYRCDCHFNGGSKLDCRRRNRE